MSLNQTRDRYESIKKRNFYTAVLNLLESEYKILGSRKILEMLADESYSILFRIIFPVEIFYNLER